MENQVTKMTLKETTCLVTNVDFQEMYHMTLKNFRVKFEVHMIKVGDQLHMINFLTQAGSK